MIQDSLRCLREASCSDPNYPDHEVQGLCDWVFNAIPIVRCAIELQMAQQALALATKEFLHAEEKP